MQLTSSPWCLFSLISRVVGPLLGSLLLLMQLQLLELVLAATRLDGSQLYEYVTGAGLVGQYSVIDVC